MTGSQASHCQWLSELLAQVDGDDDALEQVIAAHLAECPECSSEERQLATLLSRYGNDEPPQISDALESRILDLVCGRADQSKRPAER